MKWEQIDFENGIVSTIAAKKRNRRTTKPLLPQLRLILERRKASSVSDYVFPIAAMKHM